MCSHSCAFFFNDTATTEIYTLSLHDALPISETPCDPTAAATDDFPFPDEIAFEFTSAERAVQDRKSTRLNSSHSQISYAVFCLKKKTWVHVYRAFGLLYATTPTLPHLLSRSA